MFKNYSNNIQQISLIFLFFLLTFLSNINYNFNGENSFLEFFQISILLFCIILQISNKKYFLSFSNLISFSSRLLLFIFLFYEEISFITINKNSFFNSHNLQSQINIHNLEFFSKAIFKIKLPIINYYGSINGYVLLITLALLFIAYGSKFVFLKKFRYFFLEKNFQYINLLSYQVFF